MFTPPDRFLARAHLVEIKESPETLLNGTKWDQLSQAIWDKFMMSQQREETYRRKMYLWRYLYVTIKVSIVIFIAFLGIQQNEFLFRKHIRAMAFI